VTLQIIERTEAEFKVSSLDKTTVDRVIEELAEKSSSASDACIAAAATFVEATSASKNVVIAEILKCLFEVGAVGLRFEGGSGVLWAYDNAPPNASQIKPSTKVQVHPMFYQALHTTFAG
jgi:hypothetical protein